MEDFKKLREIISEYKDVPLSDSQMLELVKGKANVVVYPNMHKYKDINELIDPYSACFILYETKPNFGHWCCITLHNTELEFFDSYSGFPDSQLEYIPQEFKDQSYQNYPYLLRLMSDKSTCQYKLSYNEFPFQKLDNSTKDCGRWCVLRVLLKELSLKDFKKLFFGVYSDDFATLLTAEPNQLQKV